MNASSKPRFAVMGAGSVGCFFGGMLSRAGFPVTLIGRQSHVEAVKRDGLWLDAKAFSEHVPMQASTDASGVAGARVILFCVKSADSAEAARQMAPHLEPDALILCLQNGAENPEIVRGVLPHRVVPAVVHVATEMAGPGHVKHHGRGERVIGDGIGKTRHPGILRASEGFMPWQDLEPVLQRLEAAVSQHDAAQVRQLVAMVATGAHSPAPIDPARRPA